MRRWIGLVIVLAMLAPTAAIGKDFVNKDKENREYGEPTEDTALVYIIRPTVVGSAVRFWAFVDKELIGVTRGKGYVFTNVAPGKHIFWARAETPTGFEMEVEAGQTYYLEQVVKMGMVMARVKLVPMDADKAERLLQKLPYMRLTEEGKARGAELAEKHYDDAVDSAAKRGEKDAVKEAKAPKKKKKKKDSEP